MWPLLVALLQQTILPTASGRLSKPQTWPCYPGSKTVKCCRTALWEIQIPKPWFPKPHMTSSLPTSSVSPATILPFTLHLTGEFNYFNSPNSPLPSLPFGPLCYWFLQRTLLFPKFQSRHHFLQLQRAFVPAVISALNILLGVATASPRDWRPPSYLWPHPTHRGKKMCTLFTFVLTWGPAHGRWSVKIYPEAYSYQGGRRGRDKSGDWDWYYDIIVLLILYIK